MKKTKKRFGVAKILLCAFLALVLGFGATAASAFMPQFLNTAADFYVIDYGFPVNFITQTTDIVPNASFFPMYFTPKYEHPSFETEFFLEKFLISLVINVFIFALIVFWVAVIHFIYRKKHPKKVKIDKKSLYKPVFSDVKETVIEENE